jgi:hypothetical protein
MTAPIFTEEYAFETDPEMLTNDQRIRFIRQLQHTVKYWQSRCAAAYGLTRDEMLKQIREKSLPHEKMSP